MGRIQCVGTCWNFATYSTLFQAPLESRCCTRCSTPWVPFSASGGDRLAMMTWRVTTENYGKSNKLILHEMLCYWFSHMLRCKTSYTFQPTEILANDLGAWDGAIFSDSASRTDTCFYPHMLLFEYTALQASELAFSKTRFPFRGSFVQPGLYMQLPSSIIIQVSLE